MFDGIALFIKLVDVGSFSQLARVIDSTQATVSRRIQGLEESLKVTLLNRNQRSLELTDAGAKLYDQFKTIIDKLDSDWQLVREHLQDKVQGTIRLALTTEAARDVIIPRLHEFLQSNPEVKLHVTFTTEEIHLVKQHYDIAISSSLPNSSSHEVKLLTRLKYYLYASPQYIKKYGVPENLNQLTEHHCIASLGFTGEEHNNYLVENSVTGEQIIFGFSSNLYMDLTSYAVLVAKNNEFITGAYSQIVAGEVRRGELVAILPQYNFYEIPCYLVRKSGINSKLEQALAQFIEDAFLQMHQG
jgi:DNA-binding transcriptional LysR family regulator